MDTELLTLDRGRGKTRGVIESMLAYDWPAPPIRGVVVLPSAQRASVFRNSVIDATIDVRGGTFPDRLLVGGREVMVTCEALLDRLRGLDRTTPVWVDDAADFEGPILELVPEVAMLEVVFASYSPSQIVHIPKAPRAYNPRFIRHALGRGRRPLGGFATGDRSLWVASEAP